jgi:peroxiredoxin
MSRLTIGNTAPDFTLPDHQGSLVKLSDLYRSQNVLLVFNIGFA